MEAGTDSKVQISVGKGKKCRFQFCFATNDLEQCPEEKVTLTTPEIQNRDQVKLATARMCLFLLCFPWLLYGLHELILEVTVSFLVLSLQISTSASEKGAAAYLDGLS